MATAHRLAPGARAATVEQVASSLVALHATDPATVYLAAAARMAEPSVAAVEDALYERRSLVRMLGMRRTMFVVAGEVAPMVHAACTTALAVRERARLLGMLPDHDDRWLAGVEDSVHRLLLEKGPVTGVDISAAEPRLRTQITYAPGKSYESTGNITSRVLNILSAQGRIVRGRPLGSWTSSRYAWSAVEEWLPGGMPEVPLAAAQADLAHRWLTAFGPATADDLKWWAGWSMGATRKALAAVGAVEVDLDGTPGYLAPGTEDAPPETEPWAALLPSLDPTPMGWVARDWYLGEHGPALFDRTGNIGPTVWWNGRIVGGWGQRPGGEVVVRLLEDVGAEATAAIETERARLSTWLAGVRVTPRFRTPLERELAS
jgi:hypothetical protein